MLTSFQIFGQVVTWEEFPVDKQLYARDGNDEGHVTYKGEIEDSRAERYDEIRILVRKNSDNSIENETFTPLNYNSNDVAIFDIDVIIPAELESFNLEFYGVKDGASNNFRSTSEIVAGDVYVIQGQSNAVAAKRESSASAAGFESEFIRVYASGSKVDSTLLSQDAWNYGKGDAKQGVVGNVGQWGIKMARQLMDKYNIPIAIFNAAEGGTEISVFERPVDYKTNISSNYGKLYYRLDTTRLKNSVKAFFWIQGENDARNSTQTSTSAYMDSFTDIRSHWSEDFSGFSRIFMGQTRSACGDSNSLKVKEAQRRLAEDFNDIILVTTNDLDYIEGASDCHFTFDNGYEKLGDRMFRLVDKEIYGASAYDSTIYTPMIIDAYLITETTLIIETDAVNLYDNGIDVNKFSLSNSGGALINSLSVSDNQIIFNLSQEPDSNVNISYDGLGYGASNNSDELIFNTNTVDGISIVCFNEYPVDTSLESIWSDGEWSKGIPNAQMSAVIDADYNTTALSGNMEAKDLTVESGKTLDFDSGTTNNVIVHGDLTINGTFIIGDNEALVMPNNSSNVTGNITKKEKSTDRNDLYDITYWSSPVISLDAQISNVFPGVNLNRIFYYDQSKSQATAPSEPGYWDVWQLASGDMIAGKGYAAEGIDSSVHSIEFTGVPNNGDISVDVVYQDPGNDFNLIGNPYPSAIDIGEFLTVNTNLYPKVHLWTHNTQINAQGEFDVDDYATINKAGDGIAACGGCPIPDRYIGSGQGFFVETTTNNGDGKVEFDNSMRVDEPNDQFFKASISKSKKSFSETSKNNKIWLNLTTDKGGFNQILIAFQKGFSNNGIDKGYDVLKFSGSSNPLQFYSIANNKKLSIQGRGRFHNNHNIFLGFESKVSPNDYLIDIDKIEGAIESADIYLIDRYLNLTHDLRRSKYVFKHTQQGDFKDRFLLRFKSKISDDSHLKTDLSQSIVVHKKNDGFRVLSNTLMKEIKVINFYGNTIFENEIMDKQTYFTLGNAKDGSLLILEVKFENDEILRKKIIYY